MPKMHIVTQLCGFFVFAIMVNQLNLTQLALIVIVLLAVLLKIKSHQFLRTIKRMKWFFVAMLLIFAFNTPGEHIKGWAFMFSPTYEGIQAGFLQTLRMITLLALLSLIMTLNSRLQLISGFYFLLLPLKYAGLEVERFAARLWLTLHYVESNQQLNAPEGFLSQLKTFTNNSKQGDIDVDILFNIPHFTKLDMLVLSLLVITILYAILKVLL